MKFLKTLAEQIGSLDKKTVSVSPESRLALSCVGVEALIIQVAVVARVERRSGTRCPADDQLRAKPRADVGIIKTQAGESVTRELVRRTQAEHIVIKCYLSAIVTREACAPVVQLRLQSGGRLITN